MYQALVRNPINAIIACAALFFVLTMMLGGQDGVRHADGTGTDTSVQASAQVAEDDTAMAVRRQEPARSLRTASTADRGEFTPEDQLIDEAKGHTPKGEAVLPTFSTGRKTKMSAATDDENGAAATDNRRSRTEAEEDVIGPKWDRVDDDEEF